MKAKTIRKDENLGLELIETATGYELWSNTDDYYGYAEEKLESFFDFDVAAGAFADWQWERAKARAAAYGEVCDG